MPRSKKRPTKTWRPSPAIGGVLEAREVESILFQLLRQMLTELHPNVAPPVIRSDSSLQGELGIDSLARAELMTRIEGAFRIRLQEQTIQSAERVSDLVLAIQRAPKVVRQKEPAAHEVRLLTVERRAGPISAPSHAATLIDVLEWRAQVDSHRTWAYFHSDQEFLEELSYRGLFEKAQQVAIGLRRMDLPTRPVIALMLPTCLEFFYCFYGIQLAGGIPVPLYPPDRPGRIEEHMKRQMNILDNCEANLLIASPELRSFRTILKQTCRTLIDVVQPLDVMAPREPFERVRVSAEDVALLQYTSGSTGDPKGVVLTHSNLLSNIRAFGEVIRPVESDVFVSWLPLYHDMGLIGASMGTHYFGVPLALMSPLRFIARPERWLWMIHEHRATLSAAPNFAYELCARKVDDSKVSGLDLSAWRAAFNGAEPVSASTLNRFESRFRAYGFRAQAFTPIYGLAESSVGLTMPPLGRGPAIDRIQRDSFLKEEKAVRARADDLEAVSIVGCGMALPRHEVRIVDVSDLELRDREVGRIQFRGPSSTSGYYQNTPATRALFHGDWLDSGDFGYLVRGELYVTGRAKDVIIRAGRHIFPYDLEETIGSLPEIRKGGVAVFGKIDRDTGAERIIVLAEIRPPNTASEVLREKIRERVLAAIGIPPDDIVLAPPRSVLKTPSGKIRRKDCLRLYEQGALSRTVPVWRQWLKLRLASIIPGSRRALRRVGRIAYGVYFYWVAGLLGSAGMLALLLLPRLSWRLAVSRVLLRSIWRLTGISLRISGLENLKPEGVQIIVANHASYVDSLLLGSILPDTFRFVVKKELQQGFLGPFVRRLGSVFVERFDPAVAAKDTEDVIRAAEQGNNLVVFPEGTFTRAPGLRPFRMGAFWSAAQSGVPIVPVTLRGTRSMLREGWLFPRRSVIRITFSEPLPSAASNWGEAIRLRDRARAEILRHCGEPDLGQ